VPVSLPGQRPVWFADHAQDRAVRLFRLRLLGLHQLDVQADGEDVLARLARAALGVLAGAGLLIDQVVNAWR